MAGGPVPFNAQYPRNNFPGLEYFNQTASTVALGPRIRKATAVVVGVPAGSTQNLNTPAITLDQGWSPSHAIVFALTQAVFRPGDTSGELQIVGSRLVFQTQGNNLFEIGIPVATTLAPASPIIVNQDRDLVITFEDIQALAPAGGFGPPATLIAQATIKNNDATNAHQMELDCYAFWHQISGVLM